MQQGKIIPNGVVLRTHEFATVVFLTKLGYDVELIPKSNRPGVKSPDIKIDGILWEMKAPKGDGKWLIQNTLQKAASQAENVIVDLRRTRRHQTKCLTELKREFAFNKHLKRMKIITKDKNLLDFQK